MMSVEVYTSYINNIANVHPMGFLVPVRWLMSYSNEYLKKIFELISKILLIP